MELMRVGVLPEKTDECSKVFLSTIESTEAQNRDRDNLNFGQTNTLVNGTTNGYTIGRGPLFQITDSRVSRNHALIEYDASNKSWSMTAVRSCYYCKRNEWDQNNRDFHRLKWSGLYKNDKCELKDGYLISLLPDHKYIYQININEDSSPHNNQSGEPTKSPTFPNVETNLLNVTDESIIKIGTKEQDIVELKAQSTSNHEGSDKVRILPEWMSNEKHSKCEKEKLSRPQFDIKGTEEYNPNPKMVHFLKQWGWAIDSLDDFRNSNGGEKQERSQRTYQYQDNEGPSPDTNQTSSSKGPDSDVSWYEKAFAVANNSTSALDSNNDNRCEINSGNENLPKSEQPTSKVTSSAIQSTNIRPSCSYGATCYRKNPQHKIDAAHPGDSDYNGANIDSRPDEEENLEANDSLPECEYGTLCYRKNPQHRKEYKHTVKPRAAKRKAAIDARKRAKKRKADHVSGESESYESDFIDDSDIDEKDISSDEEDIDEWKPDDDDEID